MPSSMVALKSSGVTDKPIAFFMASKAFGLHAMLVLYHFRQTRIFLRKGRQGYGICKVKERGGGKSI